MRNLRALSAATSLLAAVSAAHASYSIHSTFDLPGGIMTSHSETRDLSAPELASLKPIGASVEVSAQALNLTLSPNQTGVARGSHRVCFSTFLTTEADYQFVLDVGGHQIVITEHIVIPAGKNTCVSHETYQQVRFPTPGSYSYSATSSGSTYSSGKRQARSQAYITVQ